MTRIYLLLLLLSPIPFESSLMAAPRLERGALIFDSVPDASAEIPDKLDAYLSARHATPLGWSPKGQLLITTRFGDVDQLHLLERAGGERRQLTFLHESITEAAFTPDPLRSAYVFAKDLGGGGHAQLYYQHLGEATAKLLTDGKSSNGGALWSNSGRELAFFSNARDGADYDINVVEPESGALAHLAVTGDSAAWMPLDWSPDDRKLLVLKQISDSEGSLYVVDLSTGQKREVDPAAAKIGIAGARFSRDGQGVYLISDRDGEFSKLRYVNLFTGDKTVISGPIPWDIEELAISRDGHYLAYVSNENGADKLNLLDLRTHQDLTPPKLPASGVIRSLSFDAEGKRLAFRFAAPNQAPDAFVLEVAGNHVEAWTHSEAGPFDASKFVTPRLAQYPTFDRQDGKQRQVPVYLYEPSTPGPHPVLLILQGGPESQFRPTFDPWIQYVVSELGFAVAAPNVRGSAGYGRSYAALDNGMLREDAVKDVGALIVWLGLQKEFDGKHMVVSGSSYGGYLTLATLVNFNDRLRGAVDVGGISNLLTFLSAAAPYQLPRRRAEFGDERDPDMHAFLRRASPLTNADRITRPLLIVHGRNDAEVPIAESEQIANRLRARGAEVWFLQATDEGHELRKKQNRDAYFKTFAQFLTSLR